MQEFAKAFCGYSADGRAFVPYTGNLTAAKETAIKQLLVQNGFRPGGKCTNVRIQPPDEKWGLNTYREDGAGGTTKVTVLTLTSQTEGYADVIRNP